MPDISRLAARRVKSAVPARDNRHTLILALSTSPIWHHEHGVVESTMRRTKAPGTQRLFLRPMIYLKQAHPPTQAVDTSTASTVRDMLDALSSGGEAVARRYAGEFDGWVGDIVVGPAAFAQAESALSDGVKSDIRFARDRVQDFARRQRDSMQEFSAELIPGLTAGQRLIPCNTAGCYVPGGRYAHAASAIMSVGTAAVAGVKIPAGASSRG